MHTSASQKSVTVHRTFDAAALNAIANHPDVFPWLGSDAPVDVTSVLDNAENYALVSDGGGFLLKQHEFGVYEVHSLFLPEARHLTVAAMRSGMHFMFEHTDCVRLVTEVPLNNQPAANLAKAGGFVEMFRRQDAPRGPTSYQILDIDMWIQSSDALHSAGQLFHDQLEQAKGATGSTLPVHADDPAHDRAVGAAFGMIRAGNVHKGIGTYNRWARLAGYAPIHALTTQPVVIDIVDAIVALNDGEMEILLCR